MQTNTIYYGVHIPNEAQIQDSEAFPNVFFDKVEALKEVKKYKKARFKAFQFYHEALEFALYGSEYPNNNSVIEATSPTSAKSETVQTVTTVGEKPSQFKGPKSQDLVKFRKSIENGETDLVKITVWENPRYLISSGDTPAILQEGSRYNALHIAAKAKNARMCDIILSTVASPDFIQILYGEENRTNSEESSKILLDLYLNTPDKGLNETPLHFAVKHGAVDVVEVLVSYPQCNKTVLNKYSQMPKDIICSRTFPTLPLIEKITSLLEDSYYVPVLRSEDNCVQPSIGEPFSPNSPPELNTNPIDPRMEIHAYAGPMKREDASVFRKKWKTPPRTPRSPLVCSRTIHSPATSDRCDSFRLQDTEKGLERVGRDLARQCNIGWKEYWPFLGTFTDLTTKEGLDQLEDFLKSQLLETFSDSTLTNSLEKKNVSDNIILNGGTSKNNSPVISPMSELCKNFEAFTLSERSSKIEVCLKPSKTNLLSSKYNDTIFDIITKTDLSPFLCIEKSCQVFANRISNHILFIAESKVNTISEALETEIKHLKSLIGSYMVDSRFSVVNFQAVHTRLANLVAIKLRELFSYEDNLNGRRKVLEIVINKYDKMVDFFSSDDEDLNCYRQPVKRRRSTSNCQQVVCLVENILKSLECESELDYKNATTESECNKIWMSSPACKCLWRCKSSRKGSLGKKSNYHVFTSHSLKITNRVPHLTKSLENVSRKLSFKDEDLLPDNKGDSIEQIENGYYSRNSNDEMINLITDSGTSSEEEYMSASSSPTMSDVEEEDNFQVPEANNLDVFIEGNEPTKMDYAVYTAIRDLQLNSYEYPAIYKWRHAVMLHSEDERMSWPSPSTTKYKIAVNSPAALTSTPVRTSVKVLSFTPPHSWLRITGQNSPIRSLKALRGNTSLPYGENCYFS